MMRDAPTRCSACTFVVCSGPNLDKWICTYIHSYIHITALKVMTHPICAGHKAGHIIFIWIDDIFSFFFLTRYVIHTIGLYRCCLFFFRLCEWEIWQYLLDNERAIQRSVCSSSKFNYAPHADDFRIFNYIVVKSFNI